MKNLIKEGQGRSPDSIANDAWGLVVTGLLCLTFICGMIACSADAKGDLRKLPQGKDNTK